jgi:hypothetical protein
MSDPLDWLARRAAAEPFFLAHRLASHQRARDLTDADLAADLGCAVEDLTMVRLCRAPRDGAEGMEDVRRVAQRSAALPAGPERPRRSPPLWWAPFVLVPGVRDPGWREVKVACCQTLACKVHAVDPQPEPPSKFLDPVQAARLAAEMKARGGKATTRSAPAARLRRRRKGRRRQRPRKLLLQETKPAAK